MQSLQEKASQWSGVSQDDAFGIDNTNLFQKLGLQTFINLSTSFYNRFFANNYAIFLFSFFFFSFFLFLLFLFEVCLIDGKKLENEGNLF